MPDGSINMPACSHDDQIGPHNMMFQCSSAGLFGYDGTNVVKAMTWNAPTITRQAAGIYRVTTQVFDIVSVNPLMIPVVSMYWAVNPGAGGAGVEYPAATDVHIPYARIGPAGFTTFQFDILIFDESGGTLADPANSVGVALEYVSFWVPGRRVVPAAATASAPFAAFGRFASTVADQTT